MKVKDKQREKELRSVLIFWKIATLDMSFLQKFAWKPNSVMKLIYQ